MSLIMAFLKFLIALALSFPVRAAFQCLPDAIRPEHRKNLTTKEQESIPVTFLVPAWPTALITSAMMEILVGEVMGFEVAVGPDQSISDSDAIYALVGCVSWRDPSNRGCETRKIRHHVVAESWWHAPVNEREVKELSNIFQEEMPQDAGDVGYTGHSGIYLSAAALQEARGASGLPLEYYQTWDATWFTPGEYFANLSEVDRSDFSKCSDTLLADNASAYSYFGVSGDASGMIITTANGITSYKFRCADEHLWHSPACRSNAEKCVLFVTGGSGWHLIMATQKIAAYHMPIAFGVASSWSTFVALPSKHRCLFYWWTPDDTFLEMNPSPVIFPPHDAYAYLRGIFVTEPLTTPMSKLVSHDLLHMAPMIVKLMQNSQLDLEAINSMLRDFKLHNSREEAACKWLKDNKARWQIWIPTDPTSCVPGFGLYDETVDDFTHQRSNATTCKVCPPGLFSEAVSTYYPKYIFMGTDYICLPCPAGFQQPTAGQGQCAPCLRGTYKDSDTPDTCLPCPLGFYQDEMGAINCTACPEGTTTLVPGVQQSHQCVCEEGSMDLSDGQGESAPAGKACVACSEGLFCPVGSTLEMLRLGLLTLRGVGPEVLTGYFSTEEAPLETYKCSPSHCPGGKPNMCAGGRLGPTCAECPAGMFWADDACTPCEISSKIGWIAGLSCILVLMIASYYTLVPSYQPRAHLRECVGMGMDMTLNFVQNLGILSAIPVPWPEGLKNLFEFSSVFVLNLQNMGLDCAFPGASWQYLLCILLFMGVTLGYPVLGFLSHAPPLKQRRLSWVPYKTVCIMGQFLKSVFTTMCNMGMVPFMCFGHPNGRLSILKYPNIFCSSHTHGWMQFGGVLVLLLGLSYFVLCVWACWHAPIWSLTARHHLRSMWFIINNYTPSTWWFGLVYLLRGTLLSVPSVVATNETGINLILMLLVMLVSLLLQLYFLPWKAPFLNLVDSTSTWLFVLLLAISLYLEPADTASVDFLGVFGVGVYYLSLAVVACVGLTSLVLLAWHRWCGGPQEPKIFNMGRLPAGEDLLSELDTISTNLRAQHGATRELLHKKLSLALSAQDLYHVQAALDILSDDCELRGLGRTSRVATKRIAANRVSQMTRTSIVRLGASTPEMGEDIQPEPNAASTNVNATQVMQVSSPNSATLEDDALDYECHLLATKVSVAL